MLGPKKEYSNYLAFNNSSLLSDNQRKRRTNKCEGNPLKSPNFTVPITCLLLPHWTLKPNNEWYHSWHSQAHQIHLKAVLGHLASPRGSQRCAPSSDHPQRSQLARQVTALHDTHPSGSFTFTLGTWSPCPCSALYSSTGPFMCLGITTYTLLTSYLLLVLFPQTTFFEAHKSLFNNGSSRQQLFIECLLCALHGARCQEYKGI